jgi:Transposase.
MSVYVGIDVHRKRSQVAVVTGDGQVQLNKNTVNGTEPILRLIGDLPAGTPVAFEAAFGWSWLAELLEDYGFEAHLVHPLRCKAIASARLKNDKVDAAILAQLLRADLLPEASDRAAPGAAAPGAAAAPGRAGPAAHPAAEPDPRGGRPISATTGPAATCPGRAVAGWPGSSCRRRRGRSSPTAWPSSTGWRR